MKREREGKRIGQMLFPLNRDGDRDLLVTTHRIVF